MAQPIARRALVSPVLRFTSPVTCCHRSFSSSSTLLSKAVPTFRPTSSPELDALLDKFRRRLFIPKALNARYEKLVFSQKKAADLQKSPVAVSVPTEQAEEDFTLEPLAQDELPTRGDMEEVLRRMETREDWQNIVPFLRGIVTSGRELRATDLERIIRKAGQAGMVDVALEIAKQASRTGATLDDPGRARALFLACRHQAQQADLKGEGLSSALSLAKQASFLMNEPMHAPAEGAPDPRRSPELAGILLELSAQQALSSNDGTDVFGDVLMYSRIVLANWEFGDFSVPSTWALANQKLSDIVPLWHGMRLARDVKEVKGDRSLHGNLDTKMGTLNEAIEQTMKMVEDSGGQKQDRLGYNIAKSLYTK